MPSDKGNDKKKSKEDYVPVVFARDMKSAEQYQELLSDYEIPVAVGSDEQLGEEDTAEARAKDGGMTHGLPVLVPLSWGIFLVFTTGLRRFRASESRFRAGLTLGALGGILAILIHSLVDFNIQITANGVLFSVFIGLAIGTFAETERKNALTIRRS